MRLQGRLSYHLALRAKYQVLRVWARAVESMPYMRVADQFSAADLIETIATYVRDFLDTPITADKITALGVDKDLADLPLATEELALAALKALEDTQDVLDALEREAEYYRTHHDFVSPPLDTALRLAEKALDDIVEYYNETLEFAAEKALADSALPGEKLAKAVSTQPVDEPRASDLVRKTENKRLLDTPYAFDWPAKTLARTLSDRLLSTYQEVVVRGLTRQTQDVASVSDSATKWFDYGRSFFEGGDYVEPVYFLGDYVAKDLGAVDQPKLTLVRPISDTSRVADTFARVATSLRTLSESPLATDIRLLTYESGTKAETVSATDSVALSLYMPVIEVTLYAEPGYFADTDYVATNLVLTDTITTTLNP